MQPETRKPERNDDPGAVLTVLVGAVLASGLGLLLLLTRSTVAPLTPVAERPVLFGSIATLLLLCEVRPLRVARGSRVDEIVASTTFAFALVLEFGPIPAMLAQAAASLTVDARERKAPYKSAFNVGQYLLTLGITGLAIRSAGIPTMGHGGGIGLHPMAMVVVGSLGFYIVNNTLVGVVVAVHARLPLVATVRDTLLHEATTDWVLLGLAPIVVVVADRSPFLLPVLLLPVAGVYRAVTVSIEKEHQATHDSLTDLPNRLLFNDRLSEVLRGGGRHPVSVFLLDLDRFKEVNDTLGHHAGDDLLRHVAERLAEVLPADATIARFGGDEFALLVPSVATAAAVVGLGEHVAEALAQPFSLGGCRIEVEASIGVALHPEHGHDVEGLVQKADTAMYLAKAAHLMVQVYDPSKDHNSRRRLALLGDLSDSISAGHVGVEFQPKLDLRTDEIDAVEALVRWNHPEHGPISPGEFIPLAERTGLIQPLTSHVLDESARQLRDWRRLGLDLTMGVNLAARSLIDLHLVQEIGEVIERWGLEPAWLQLEITESSIMTDPARARRTLGDLDAMGVGLSIDDFGTGYSSLAYLQQLPVRELKIDRSFIRDLATNPADRVIVESTIYMASRLGLEVTAEGVEDEDTLRLLSALGCHRAQGF